MARNNTLVKLKGHRPGWCDVLKNCTLVLLLGCTFVSEQAIELAHAQVEGIDIHCAYAYLSPDGYSLGPQPFNRPLDAESDPQDHSVSEEKESGDGDDFWSKLPWNSSRDSHVSRNLRNSLLRQLARSIENRSRLSLFILHHAWRSFLA